MTPTTTDLRAAIRAALTTAPTLSQTDIQAIVADENRKLTEETAARLYGPNTDT